MTIRVRIAKHSISATKLSELAICQQMVALSQQCPRVAPSPDRQRRLAEGERMHEFSREAASEPGAGKGACFIASAVYGPWHPKTRQLRAFRDRALRPSFLGRYLIATYYRFSPPIARYLGRHHGVRAWVRKALDFIVFLMAPSSLPDAQSKTST
jgi:hypothetical protein